MTDDAAPSAPAPSPAQVLQARRERQGRLGRLAGPGECSAALLALLLTGSKRERMVWFDECQQVAGHERILQDVAELTGPERAPWMERLAARMARESADDRRNLLRAARRVMAADGVTSPRDRLRWLGLRHAVTHSTRVHGDPTAVQAPDLESLDEYHALAVARFSAFLSRLVPVPELDMDLTDDAAAPGDLWWRAVLTPWPTLAVQRETPDTDALAGSLQTLQALPWMLQPVLVRRWVDAATVLSPPGLLHPDAAEALRIAARLLDSPLPPDLAACFDERLDD
jgi:hypothetical protein